MFWRVLLTISVLVGGFFILRECNRESAIEQKWMIANGCHKTDSHWGRPFETIGPVVLMMITNSTTYYQCNGWRMTEKNGTYTKEDGTIVNLYLEGKKL